MKWHIQNLTNDLFLEMSLLNSKNWFSFKNWFSRKYVNVGIHAHQGLLLKNEQRSNSQKEKHE